jgi:hypothetical protein
MVAALGSMAFLALAQSPAHAVAIGPRVGLTADPDQVHLGLHLHLADMTPRVSFEPSGDVGVGSDIELLSFNFDIRYRFSMRNSSWSPYLGAGPALHWVNSDGDDNSEVGLGFLGGMQTRGRTSTFFTEMRLGLIDSPDLKFTVGWKFR